MTCPVAPRGGNEGKPAWTSARRTAWPFGFMDEFPKGAFSPWMRPLCLGGCSSLAGNGRK